jgi:hypothetical protein
MFERAEVRSFELTGGEIAATIAPERDRRIQQAAVWALHAFPAAQILTRFRGTSNHGLDAVFQQHPCITPLRSPANAAHLKKTVKSNPIP